MFIEIEEAVCFLASFLYGSIPRSRIDSFSELLANALSRLSRSPAHTSDSITILINVGERTDQLIQQAALDAFLCLSELLPLFPSDLVLLLSPGSVAVANATSGHTTSIYPTSDQANGSAPTASSLADRRLRPSNRRRPIFHVEMTFEKGSERSLDARPAPNFEVQRPEHVYSAQAFASTRFGSTKLKTFPSTVGSDSQYGNHPFTMPSVYAYLRLLVFLNAISCVAMLKEEEQQADEDGCMPGPDMDDCCVKAQGDLAS